MQISAERLTAALREPRNLLAAAVALAVAVPAVDRAGYPAGAQAVFVAAAGIALIVAIVMDERGVLAALRARPVLALIALAILSLASTAWTVLRPLDSLRWGLVIAAYAGLAVAAGALARRPRGVTAIAAGLALLSAGEAVLGLSAAALRELPYAERIGGSWRAGGTFEYSAALALLEVMALPALLAAMVRARTGVACAAAAAGALAAGTVATSESRLELALAIVTAVAAMAWPARSRASTVAAVALLTVAGTAVRLTVGGYVAPGHVAGGALRLAELAVIVAATAGAWLVVRTPIRSAARRRFIRHHPPKSIVWLLAIGVAGAAFVIGTAPLHGRGIEPIAGFLHGRASQWSAAWRAFGDRPALGAGAGSFLAASARYQGPAPVRYAHDLPLEAAVELGVAGLLATVALYATTVAAAGAEALRRPSEAWLVVPGVVAFLVANLVDWEWDLPLSGAVWAVVLGGMIAAAPQAAQRERRR